MSQPVDDQLVAEYLHRLRAAAAGLPADRASELAEEIEAHIAEARAAAPPGTAAVRGILDRLGEPADIVAVAAESSSDLPGTGIGDGTGVTGSPGVTGTPAVTDSDGGPGDRDAPGHPAAATARVMTNAPAMTGTSAGATGATSQELRPGTGAPGTWEPDPGWRPVQGWQPSPGWQQDAGWEQDGWGPGDGRGAGWSWASSPAGAGPLEICAVIFLLIGGIVVPVLGWLVGVILLWTSPRWTSKDKLLGTLIWPGGLLAPIGLLLVGGLAQLTVSAPLSCVAAPAAVHATSPGHPVGHPAVHCATAAPSAFPPWLTIVIAVVLIALAVGGPIYIAARLLKRARHGTATATARTARTMPA